MNINRRSQEYETMVGQLLTGLSAENLDKALQLARLPEDIRGYGHVKEKSLQDVNRRKTEIMRALAG